MSKRWRITLTVLLAALMVLYLIPFVVAGIGGWWSVGTAGLSIAALVAIWMPRRRKAQ